MNRKQRRAATPESRKSYQNGFYDTYLMHPPKVDCPDFTKPGGTHVVLFHNDWCGIYSSSRTCTCDPDIEYRVEPCRS